MSAPQSGYPPQVPPGHPQEPYGGTQPGYEGTTSPVQGDPQAGSAAGRKKRQYAGQAYDFGAGPNSALGGQQPGGTYPGPPAQGFGAYGQAPQQPAYGANPSAQLQTGAPSYGQPPPAVGGYQPPEAGYPNHGATSMLGSMGGITQGMSNLGVGVQPQQPPQQVQQRPVLNQLFPTDILNQPFNVSELDRPPPPIILPPNVS